MGAIATAFINAFKLAANTDPADCQALGSSIETYVDAPRTHNNNAAAAPTSAPTGYVLRSIGADTEDASHVVDAFDGTATLLLRSANGTGATPTGTLSGNLIADLSFSGYYTSGGPGYSWGASTRAYASENHTSTARGTYLSFFVTANGTATPVEAFRINQDQSLFCYGKVGYGTGVGGSVTQLTSKATPVTLDKLSGEITMHAAALAAGAIVSFGFTNSSMEAADLMIVNHVTGGTLGAYLINGKCFGGAGSIEVRNTTAGSLSEAIVLRFAIIRGTLS